jgi:hypothetical protein
VFEEPRDYDDTDDDAYDDAYDDADDYADDDADDDADVARGQQFHLQLD